LRSVLYCFPRHFFRIRSNQDQNRHAGRGLKKPIEGLDGAAGWQCHIQHHRPDTSISQTLDSAGEFRNPLRIEPLVLPRIQFLQNSRRIVRPGVDQQDTLVAMLRVRMYFRFKAWAWHLFQSTGNELLSVGFFSSVGGHETQHLFFQLRIHLVRDGHHVGQQRFELQLIHVFVQRGKNTDLQ